MVSSASFCDFVDIETDYLTRQVQLLRMVTWWYLLPLYIGGVLIVAGLTDPFRGSLFEPIFLSIYMRSALRCLFTFGGSTKWHVRNISSRCWTITSRCERQLKAVTSV